MTRAVVVQRDTGSRHPGAVPFLFLMPPAIAGGQALSTTLLPAIYQ